MEKSPDRLESEAESNRLKDEYLGRLRWLLRRAPAEVREDALREVNSHIDDEWQATGEGLEALRSVLERLGSPEAYGRDLALQLMMLGEKSRRSLLRLALGIIFWASTSLVGSLVVIGATLVFAFSLGMLVTGFSRMFGSTLFLLDARSFQLFNTQYENLRFPPETWSPLLIIFVGLLPSVIAFMGLYRFLSMWVRSRLAQRGFALVQIGSAPALPNGWERKAVLAMLVFAVIGMSGCMLFSLVSQMVPIGRPGTVSLPEDLFRTPLTALASLSGLVFLISPVLGLLWAAKRNR